MQDEARTLRCPRDGGQLHSEKDHAIEVEACPTCRGAWYDFGELAQLEATVTHDEGSLAGMLEYSKRDSELKCPVCQKTMVAFDYRAHAVELDACPDEHGFWLDAGESARVREIMQERVGDMQRSASAEQRWNRDRESGFKRGGVIDRIRELFGGRR